MAGGCCFISGHSATTSRAFIRRVAQRGFAVCAEEAGRRFFGPATRDALLEFQKRLGLDATGTIDRKTAAALSVACGAPQLARELLRRRQSLAIVNRHAPLLQPRPQQQRARRGFCSQLPRRTGGSLSGGTLHPGPHTPPSGGSINTGTTGPISGGTINPGPRHDAATENLTKVANAFAAKHQKRNHARHPPAGLNLTEPVQISILFESARITQDYVNSSGNHFLYNFDDGDAQLRREPARRHAARAGAWRSVRILLCGRSRSSPFTTSQSARSGSSSRVPATWSATASRRSTG